MDSFREMFTIFPYAQLNHQKMLKITGWDKFSLKFKAYLFLKLVFRLEYTGKGSGSGFTTPFPTWDQLVTQKRKSFEKEQQEDKIDHKFDN